MKHLTVITVIGATGRLAPMVVRQLLRDGFTVRALVRDAAKARRLLPAAVEVVVADLTDRAALRAGLRGTEAVYLNLATVAPQAAFQPELDGVRNILVACAENHVRRIYKISGLGAHRPDFARGRTIFINEIRAQGHALLERSSIPYTLFHPSWFMESLELMFRKGDKLTGFKPIHHPIHWIAGRDYARMVSAAISRPDTGNRHYVMQGPEAVTMHDALVRYAAAHTPPLRVTEFPIGLVKLVGLVVPSFRILGLMGDYFRDFKEEFIAADTWDRLGAPHLTLDTFRAAPG